MEHWGIQPYLAPKGHVRPEDKALTSGHGLAASQGLANVPTSAVTEGSGLLVLLHTTCLS